MKQIFVGGTGRSGTTIVYKVLESHPDIVTGPVELRIHIDPGGALDVLDSLSTSWNPQYADIALHRFNLILKNCAQMSSTTKWISRFARKFNTSPKTYIGMHFDIIFGANYKTRIEEIINNLSDYESDGYWLGSHSYVRTPVMYETRYRPRSEVAAVLREFFNNLYLNISQNGQTHWAESTPYSILFADQLLELFPDAKFLHIYRDPRDVTASYLTQRWGGRDLLSISKRIADINKRWFEVRQRIPNSSYREYKLEEIVEYPENKFAEISSFIQLDDANQFDLSMIQSNQSNQQRWKTDIPANQLAEILDVLQPSITGLGYD
jgi:hypothetical protein